MRPTGLPFSTASLSLLKCFLPIYLGSLQLFLWLAPRLGKDFGVPATWLAQSSCPLNVNGNIPPWTQPWCNNPHDLSIAPAGKRLAFPAHDGVGLSSWQEEAPHWCTKHLWASCHWHATHQNPLPSHPLRVVCHPNQNTPLEQLQSGTTLSFYKYQWQLIIYPGEVGTGFQRVSETHSPEHLFFPAVQNPIISKM